VVLGTGGVGKTTVAAALGLRLAELGHRTAVVTLDPARRLADALHVSRGADREEPVPLETLSRRVGARFPGSLMGGVLDTQAMFDRLVREVLDDPGRADLLLNNTYYRKLSTSLAGAEDYMAVARLHELMRDGRYDRVVLDTPPAFHTLRFLTTPERLLGFFAVPGVQAALRLMRASTSRRWRFLQLGRVPLAGLERFLGREFLHELSDFLVLFTEVLEAFAERVKRVAALLNSPEVGYLLVVAPGQRSLAEAERILTRLKAEGRATPTVLVNRVHRPRFTPDELDQLPQRFAARVNACPCSRVESAWVRDSVARQVPELVAAHEAGARREEELLERYRSALGPMLKVEEMDRDVDDLEGLWQFSRLLGVPDPTAA